MQYLEIQKRLWSGLITVSELTNEKPEKLLKKLMEGDEGLSKEIHVRPQSYFIKNYNIQFCIDLESPFNEGTYRKHNWGKVFGERQIVRDVVEMLTEINDDTGSIKEQM